MLQSSVASQIYQNKHVLAIGINKYPHLKGEDQLTYARKDAEELVKLLVEEFAFPKTNIVTLYDDQATKENIIRELDNLTDNQKVGPEDQVLVFFSGHGQTIKTPIGGDVGYLVPADASVTLKDNSNPGDYVKKCIPMDKLKQASGLSQAKHLLFLVDACYSGLAAGAKGSRSEQPLDKLKDLRAHDIITAGLKSEIVKENPKWGHGAFTYKLLGALKEKLSDANQDSLTTGSELSTYLKNSVPEIANQNPQYARFSGEGEFVFEHQDPVSLDKQSPRLYFVQSQSEGKSKGFKRKRKNQLRLNSNQDQIYILAIDNLELDRIEIDGKTSSSKKPTLAQLRSFDDVSVKDNDDCLLLSLPDQYKDTDEIQSLKVDVFDRAGNTTTKILKILPPGEGTLVLQSSPIGAKIYLDGKFHSYTPKVIQGVAAGSHELMLVQEGETHSQTITIETNKVTKVNHLW